MGHEFIDHTSEITLRVQAPTFPALIAEATVGIGELVPQQLRTADTGEWIDFDVPGPDRATTLVGWLNEIVYLCEAEQRLPVEVEAVVERADGLSVRARCVELEQPWVAIKAATLHRASVVERPEGVTAEVTLDV